MTKGPLPKEKSNTTTYEAKVKTYDMAMISILDGGNAWPLASCCFVSFNVALDSFKAEEDSTQPCVESRTVQLLCHGYQRQVNRLANFNGNRGDGQKSDRHCE